MHNLAELEVNLFKKYNHTRIKGQKFRAGFFKLVFFAIATLHLRSYKKALLEFKILNAAYSPFGWIELLLSLPSPKEARDNGS